VSFLTIGFAAVGAAVLLGWLIHLERTDRPEIAVLLVFAVVVLEVVLYPVQTEIPSGVFHLGGGSTSFRTLDGLIPIALLARLIVRRTPRAIGAPALWWVAFCFWILVGMYAGPSGSTQAAFFAIHGWLSFDPVLPRYQAKEIIYLGGAYALAAGVPMIAYIRRQGVLQRLLMPAGALATVVFLTTMVGQSFSISLPGLKGATIGDPGADTASAFVVLAMLALTFGSARVARRPWLVAFCLPLTLSVALAEQRAAFIGILASYGLLLVVLFSSNAKRRLISRPTEGFLVFMAIAAMVLISTLGPVMIGQRDELQLPFHGRINSTFTGKGKSESAADRRLIWKAAEEAIKQRPAFGWGLGRRIRAYRTGYYDFTLYPDMHNIYLDLLLRRGLVGLGLFLMAVALSLRDGWRVWRFHPDSRVAAMAIGAIAGIMGLLGKGLVESIFEKYRLAILLGLLLGMLRSARTSLTDDEWSRHPERLPEPIAIEG